MSRTAGRPPNRSRPSHDEIREFVVVRTTLGLYQVTRREGARIADLLARWWVPRWLEFTDVHGAMVRVRPTIVLAMYDSTATMRFGARAWDVMFDREEERDRKRLSTMPDADSNIEPEEE